MYTATLRDAIGRKRFAVPVVSFAHDDEQGLVLMELAGATNANRAIWAHLVKRRTERSLTTTNITVEGPASSSVVQLVPGKQVFVTRTVGTHLLILHRRVTQSISTILLGGTLEEPSPHFRRTMNMYCPFPVLEAWLPILWRQAVRDGQITPPTVCVSPLGIWMVTHHQNESGAISMSFAYWEKVYKARFKELKRIVQ